MTTLRDILTGFSQSVWENNAGDVYTMEDALEAWFDDLDRYANCMAGQIHFLDESGYVEGGEPVLREVSPKELKRREELIDAPKPKPMGRPRVTPEGARSTTVLMTPDQRALLLRVGNGNISEGFRLVMQDLAELQEELKED